MHITQINKNTKSIYLILMVSQYILLALNFFVHNLLINLILIIIVIILGIFTAAISSLWFKKKMLSKILFEFAVFNLISLLPTIIGIWLAFSDYFKYDYSSTILSEVNI